MLEEITIAKEFLGISREVAITEVADWSFARAALQGTEVSHFYKSNYYGLADRLLTARKRFCEPDLPFSFCYFRFPSPTVLLCENDKSPVRARP